MFSISVMFVGAKVAVRETLAHREVFVGRSRKCQVMLRDDTVSGIHCRLVAIEGGAVVMDEGSTNGTFLNGQLVVRPTVMTVNDELRVGPYSLRVQSLAGGVNAPSPREQNARSRHIDPPVSVEAGPAEERLMPQERPTDLQLSQSQVFWRILGFQEPGTLEQARAAYEAQAQSCQPDTVSEVNPQLRDLAEQRLREIEFAWQYIQRLFHRAKDAA